MSDTPLHSVSVAGVTFDDTGRVLLIKRRDNGQWQAPGGILEIPETFEAGVAREVQEETGVEVTVDRLTGVYKNIRKGVVALVYRCSPVGGNPMPSEESIEVVWVDLEAAIRRMTPAFAIRVEDAAHSASAGVASRTHDGVDLC
jgi:ADP-ribose pyrophosphatase YjhB (NUDIX family)